MPWMNGGMTYRGKVIIAKSYLNNAILNTHASMSTKFLCPL